MFRIIGDHCLFSASGYLHGYFARYWRQKDPPSELSKHPSRHPEGRQHFVVTLQSRHNPQCVDDKLQFFEGKAGQS